MSPRRLARFEVTAPPVNVVQVSDRSPVIANGWGWQFDGDVDVSNYGGLSDLQVEDPGSPGNFQSPFLVVQESPSALMAFYPSGPESAGLMWQILIQPAGIINAVVNPQTGTTA